MNTTFEAIFATPNAARDKYLARLFGVFNEDVVRAWCACEHAPYENLGAPSWREWGTKRWGWPIDFTLRQRETGHVYVAEMKCWPEWGNHKYLRLQHVSQLQAAEQALKGNAQFTGFLRLAKDPAAFQVCLREHPQAVRQCIAVDGAVLIWSACTAGGRDAAKAHYGFADVLSVEQMLTDLHTWLPQQWATKVSEWQSWLNELFASLAP